MRRAPGHSGVVKSGPWLVRFCLGLALVLVPGMLARLVWPVWPLTLFPDISGLASSARQPAQVQPVVTNLQPASSSNTRFLHNADAGLTNFFAALRGLESGQRRHVRVLHYGDSMLWHENTARRIRELLQRQFGDGGRGFVYLHHGDFGVNLDGHTTSGDSFPLNTIPFEHFNHKEPKWLSGLGFSGMSWFSPSPAAVTRQRMTGRPAAPWTEVELLLRPRDYQRGRIQTVTVRGIETGSNARFATNLRFHLSEGTVAHRFAVPPSRDVSFSFSDPLTNNGPSAWIDALQLESAKGLVYNTVIHKGRHMGWMTAITSNAMREGYRAWKPDLVIMQFGINESASINWKSFDYSEEYYLRQMRELYSRLREAVPHCDVLVLLPYERLKPENGEFINYAEHDRVRILQRQVAAEFGFAWFDSWGFWGGAGQMRRLIRERLAHTDYAHLTMEGGDRMGEGIVAEILADWTAQAGGEKVRIEDRRVTHGQVDAGDEASAIMFNSTAYLLFFVVVFLMSAVLLRFGVFRLVFLTVASWYFYASWQFWALGLMWFSTLVDYLAGIRIHEARLTGSRARTRLWLVFSLVGNLGLLFSFKYHDFIAGLINPLLEKAALPGIPLLDLILPVGISFYTFQTLSYTIDIYRGELLPERNFWRFSLFVSFFPQLVAGPIVRAREFLPGLRERIRHFRPDSRVLGLAFWLIGTGLVKKCLADWIAMNHVDRVFQMPSMYTATEAILAVYGFGAQIFLDFSSYTAMAIGSALILGFNLTENFNEPYKSVSISDFWRRWHISLGSWIRDYIYISLGGNRRRVYLNLFITMFLAGLWHGAGINFVLWGVFHGLFLMLERALGWNRVEREALSPWKRLLATCAVFHVVMLGWLLFRSHDWAMFEGMIQSIASGIWVAPNVGLPLVLALAAPFVWHFVPTPVKGRIRLIWTGRPALQQGAGAAFLFLVATALRIAEVKSFIYFQF